MRRRAASTTKGERLKRSPGDWGGEGGGEGVGAGQW